MNTVRQSCRPKHQVLVLKCYPRYQKGAQQVKANPSELSYLLYYASTRRSKLPKVAAFLEKRTARDVWRGKFGNVQVTLQILTSLIEKLPGDLTLYCRSILTILEVILRSGEITMVEETLPTFDAFCHYQDMGTLAADKETLDQYRHIVGSYAELASSEQTTNGKTALSAPLLLRWKNASLQAIKSVVTCEALATDGVKQLNLVVPVILDNVYCNGLDMLLPLLQHAENSEKQEEEVARRRRMSTTTVQTADANEVHPDSAPETTADADKFAETEVRVLALRCLEKIFVPGSNKVQIRVATSLALQFIVAKRAPWRYENKRAGNWATNLIEVIAKWAPVQDRFIILVAIMETLLTTRITKENLGTHLTLVSLLDWLVSSSINLIGLSVMDVLLGLLQHLLRVLQHMDQFSKASQKGDHSGVSGSDPAQETAQPESTSDTPQAVVTETSTSLSLQGELVNLLLTCIGDLATHIYYPDQVSDIVRAILLRLTPPSANTEAAAGASDNPQASQVKLNSSADASFSSAVAHNSALKAVKNVLVVANLRGSITDSVADSRNRVPIQVWQRTQWLLSSAGSEVRRHYVDALLSWLQLETTQDDLKIVFEVNKTAKANSKRDFSDPSNNLARRVISTSRRESTSAAMSAFRFLQVLHLTIYDLAIESTGAESEILLLHLLLANLVESLGVNAARHGLPMILELQKGLITSKVDTVGKLNIASLVYGYLWALVEKFNIESTKVGGDIVGEISRRKAHGVWLDKIQLPPRPLDHITPDTNSSSTHSAPQEQKYAFVPFSATEELVNRIEDAYNSSIASRPTSPPSSGLMVSIPGFGQSNGSASTMAGFELLPINVKEQLLSPWSREVCMAALEAETAKSSSLSGSKTGTSGTRNNAGTGGDKNGSASQTETDGSPNRHIQLPERPGSATFSPGGDSDSIQRFRRQSNPERSHTPLTMSSRDSTVKVNDLRRVLSVINNSSHVRLSSPLRGRPSRRSSSSGSSSDSMVSDTFSGSDGRSQSRYREGSETPKATDAYRSDMENANRTSMFGLLERSSSNDIPPVPPLPSALAVPGGFPSESTSGSSAPSPTPPLGSERPSTAPSQPRQKQTANGQANIASPPRQSRSLTRQKSRSNSRSGFPANRPSSSHYHAKGYSESGPGPAINNNSEFTSITTPVRSREASGSAPGNSGSPFAGVGDSVDIDKLLSGALSGENSRRKSLSTSPPTQRSSRGIASGEAAGDRRRSSLGRKSDVTRISFSGRFSTPRGGIGRPPY